MNESSPISRAARRRFLRRAGTLAGQATLLGFGATMAGAPVLAQSGDYRALVCVFLYGGNDGLNMVPPTDPDAHARYAAVRGPLALARQDIVPLDGTIGLHPAMTELGGAWADNRLAVICNAGPLSRPTTLADFLAWRDRHDNAFVPDSLFSHADQQILWENGHADALVRSGWGGRLLEALGTGQPTFTFGGNSRFGTGDRQQELGLPGPGSRLGLDGFDQSEWATARMGALQALVGQGSTNRLQQAFSASQRTAFDTSSRLGGILEQAPDGASADAANPELSAAFNHLAGASGGHLSRQLYQVAKMIKQRAVVGGNRHVFFVSLGGFDNHADQAGDHAALMGELSTALAAFQRAMDAVGSSNQVTLFTESDFGRTFKPNSSNGTDHAWGNQQLVLGGAVNGGARYGSYPSLMLGGPDDAGENEWEHQGRWIPSVSVDQYAATLAAWFAPELGGNLAAVLPNLSRFSVRNLGFV
ncbi:MAG: DUF1501 domain-containing protein [Burkholderiaceae bacterium]